MPLVDFTELKRRVSMRDVLQLIGWTPDHYEPAGLRGRCPIHLSSSPRSRSFSVSEAGFQCFSCKARGDQIRLYATVKGVDVYRAAHQLAEALGFAVPYQTAARPVGKVRNGEEER